MFFPQEMTALELIIPEKDLLAVTNVLTRLGVFHQVDASHLGSRAKSASVESWKERASIYATLERQILLVMQALEVEEGTPPRDEEPTVVEIDEIRSILEQIEGAVKNTTGEMAANQKRLEQLQANINELEPVADIDLDLGMLRDPKYIHSIFGSMPVSNLERLQTSLARTPSVLLTLREDRKNAVVWLTGASGNADILDRAARSAYLNPFDFKGTFQGTPSETIQSLKEEIKATQGQIEIQKAEIAKLREKYAEQLQSLLWSVRTSRMLADAMAHYGKLKYTYLIVGWTPSARLATLTEQLKQASKNIIIETTPSKRDVAQNVPVALQNPGILSPFQSLTITYARPRYNEIDPTVLITITFPLLFGAMFGDVGHGLLLAIMGWLISSKRVPALRGMASLGPIVLICGLVSIVFGFLYGSIFGFEEILPHSPFFSQFIWMQPIHHITDILLVAVGAGVVILSIGFLLNIYNAWVARDWARLFFDPNGLAGLVLYWSLLGLALSLALPAFPIPTPVFVALAVVGGVAVMFSEFFKHLVEGHRPLIEGGIGMFLFQSVVELFEKLISLFSNTMSYVRVGAFAVAHAGLSGAFFVLGELVDPSRGIGYWIVLIIGNIFIVGFEGLIVGIQTMRLHYYEFFSKFFTGGGAPYEPLRPLRAEEPTN
jgi:V/A-type H+-transporting ATPase subunit I